MLVSVTNANKQTSNGLPFIVRPVPVIESALPNPIPVGGTGLNVAVTGRNFFDGVKIQWNGQELATTFVSVTQLTVAVPATLLTQLGSATLTALTPDGVRSAPYIQPIGSISINVPNLTVGDGNVAIVITGSGFGPGTGVQLSCPPAAPVALTTANVTASSISVIVPGSLLTQVGTCQIIVTNPGPVTIAVPVNPRPQISTLSPSTALAGQNELTLTITGAGFENGSVVNWNGTSLAATLSGGELKTTVTKELLGKPGAVVVNVIGPRGSKSNDGAFRIVLPEISLKLSVPASTGSGKMEQINLGLLTGFPLDLAGTLTLKFSPDGALPPTDDGVAFAGPNKFVTTFNVASNSLVVPSVNFMTGTTAGVITITPQFTSGGEIVTGTGLGPQTLTLPRIPPVISVFNCMRKTGAFDVVADGFTNTRQATQAVFTFTGNNLGTSSLTVDASTAFSSWAATNMATGVFKYTQTFNVQGSVSDISRVTMRLTNSAGQSTESSASCQ